MWRRCHSYAAGQFCRVLPLRAAQSARPFCSFHAAGSVQDVEMGHVDGTPTCQFMLCTTSWNAEEASGAAASANTPKGRLNQAVKTQLAVRCTGSHKFLTALSTSLHGGAVVELSGEIVLHNEVIAPKRPHTSSAKGSNTTYQHTELRVTEEGLRSTLHSLRVLYSGPMVSSAEVQQKLNESIFTSPAPS